MLSPMNNANDNNCRKNLHLVGFRESLPFNTAENLKFLGKNNIYLVELHQNTRQLFQNRKYSFEELYKGLADLGYISVVCNNYAKIALLEPHLIIPVSDEFDARTHNEKIEMLNSIIPCFVANELRSLDYSLKFNDLVFFGGLPHIDSIKECLNNNFSNLDVYIARFL